MTEPDQALIEDFNRRQWAANHRDFKYFGEHPDYGRPDSCEALKDDTSFYKSIIRDRYAIDPTQLILKLVCEPHDPCTRDPRPIVRTVRPDQFHRQTDGIIGRNIEPHDGKLEGEPRCVRETEATERDVVTGGFEHRTLASMRDNLSVIDVGHVDPHRDSQTHAHR
jgi:hypothetical protein